MISIISSPSTNPGIMTTLQPNKSTGLVHRRWQFVQLSQLNTQCCTQEDLGDGGMNKGRWTEILLHSSGSWTDTQTNHCPVFRKHGAVFVVEDGRRVLLISWQSIRTC